MQSKPSHSICLHRFPRYPLLPKTIRTYIKEFNTNTSGIIKCPASVIEFNRFIYASFLMKPIGTYAPVKIIVLSKFSSIKLNIDAAYVIVDTPNKIINPKYSS